MTDNAWLETLRQRIKKSPLVVFADTECPQCGFTDTEMIYPGNIPEVKALVEDITAIREAIERNCAPFEPIHSLKVVGKVTLDASLIVPLLKHLAPFEAHDAT